MYYRLLMKKIFRISNKPVRLLLALFIVFSSFSVKIPQVNADAGSTRVMCEEDTSLVGCWRMEEGSGTTLQDGGAEPFNDAATVASPGFVTGQVGSYAIELNGTSQYATTADEASLNITNAITLSAWIYTTKIGTQYVIKKAVQGATNGYELSLASTGFAFVRF